MIDEVARNVASNKDTTVEEKAEGISWRWNEKLTVSQLTSSDKNTQHSWILSPAYIISGVLLEKTNKQTKKHRPTFSKLWGC